MSNNTEGKAVITGASSGLDEAIARLLSAQGVIIVLSRGRRAKKSRGNALESANAAF